MRFKFFSIVVFLFSVGACVPSHLKKYQRDAPKKQSAFEEQNIGPAANIEPGAVDPSPPRKAVRSEPAKRKMPTIYAIEEKVFRFQLPSDKVWDAALNVLLRNYNLNIVDQESGIVTTEWDTFYLNEEVMRNKVSMRIQRINRSSCDVLVHNSVEKMSSGAAQGAVGAVWLPSEGGQTEVARLVQNMAILLNQPPPTMPGGNVAGNTGFSNGVLR